MNSKFTHIINFKSTMNMYASQRCVVGGIYAHDPRLTPPVLYMLSYYHCTILHPLLVLQTVRRPKKV